MELSQPDEVSLRDRILALRSLPSMQALEYSTLALMAERAVFRFLKPGEVILEEGSLPHSVFMILDGEVEVERKGRRVATVRRNFGVGFLSLLGSDENGVVATVTKPTQALQLSAQAILAAYEEDFSLPRNSLRLAARSVAELRGGMPTGVDNPDDADPGDPSNRARTMVERVIQMRQGPLFRDCNIDAVIELVRRGRDRPFEKGDVLWRQGEPSRSYIRIDDGLIRCTNDAGAESIVGAGFTLGVMDAFGQLPRSYTATAIADGNAFELQTEVFMSILETHFDLMIGLIGAVTRPLLMRE